MKTRFGVTIVELLAALMIFCFLGIVSKNMFLSIESKANKLKFKNANLSFKHALASMIENPAYYSDEAGFSDLEEVVFNDKFVSRSINYSGTKKFRHLLLKELGVSIGTGNLDCYMLTDSLKPKQTRLCYQAQNGVIWGIPDTNFYDKGVLYWNNSAGGKSNYTPVTIYINNKKINSADDFYAYSIVIGVRSDGALSLINTIDNCNDEKAKTYAQCEIADVFASLKMVDRKE